MLYIFNNGSWMKPLNWNLQVNDQGEPCVPFSHYVQPERTDSSSSTFPQFRKLAAELQLHILRFCDAQTLFNLMQTSSTIRLEASKLFWSLPDAWYNVNSHWLLRGGVPGYMEYALDFQAHIEQVEVEIFEIDSLRDEWEGDRYIGPTEDKSFPIEEQIRGFWQTLQSRFPRAARVVISESEKRISGETPPDDLKLLVQMCPSNITAFASILRRAPDCHWNLERSLWQPVGMNADGSSKWEVIDPLWTRKNILIPLRELHGPVGACQHLLYQYQRFDRLKDAMRLLCIEALEIRYFDGQHTPFSCPKPQCEAYFKQRGEWTLHAIGTHHDEDTFEPDQETQFFYERHQKRLDLVDQEIGITKAKLKKHWGLSGSPERHIAEQSYLDQLDHDPLYAVQGRVSREGEMWRTIRTFLSQIENDPL